MYVLTYLLNLNVHVQYTQIVTKIHTLHVQNTLLRSRTGRQIGRKACRQTDTHRQTHTQLNIEIGNK